MNKDEIIKDWVKKGYGCPAVKLEEITQDGFIVSKLKEIKAGMERDLHSGRLISIPIRTIRKERIYLRYWYNEVTGDIYGGELISNYSYRITAMKRFR